MKGHPLFFVVKQFLERSLVSKGPLLLGYSGGPDSTALLRLLLLCKEKTPFSLHVAHVDHGWRAESRSQAERLQKEVEELGCSFHLKTLDKENFGQGNWEGKGRELRLRFFSELYEQLGAQALVLGHHADDWAEGVLKRLFEGASLPFLGGLSEKTQLEGMRVYRPLLSFSKKEIIAWLQQQEIPYLSDATNEDVRFLRGRMRRQLLPLLTDSFGKEIQSNLCRLGEEAQELRHYFLSVNQAWLSAAREQGYFDLKPHLPVPAVRLKYFLKEWIQVEGVFLSHQMLCDVIGAVQGGRALSVCSGRGGFRVSNGSVFIIKCRENPK